MSCSLALWTVMLRNTNPSARSTRMPTSLWPATSTTTSSALTPEPSICRLQRMHGPRLGMPWRASSGGRWLLVDARHDPHAVVVARVLHRGVDLVVLAEAEQRLVYPLQPVGLRL